MQEVVKEIRDVLSEVKYPGIESIVALDGAEYKVEDNNWIFAVFQSPIPVCGAVKKKCESLLKRN
ncbi:MAG: hypothetical protein ACLTZT_19080 [Butyricimonas faecalis]